MTLIVKITATRFVEVNTESSIEALRAVKKMYESGDAAAYPLEDPQYKVIRKDHPEFHKLD